MAEQGGEHADAPAPATSATRTREPGRGARRVIRSICFQALATTLPGSVSTPRSPSRSGTLTANRGLTRQRVAPYPSRPLIPRSVYWPFAQKSH